MQLCWHNLKLTTVFTEQLGQPLRVLTDQLSPCSEVLSPIRSNGKLTASWRMGKKISLYVDCSWNVMATVKHRRGSEGETGEWSG